MHPSPIKAVVADFFRRTTLHGFKYLCSRYSYDRMVWVVICCASACSAGVLCAVLWARFLQQPAVVALKDLQVTPRATDGMPAVFICPPANLIADEVVAQFKQVSNKSRLSVALTRVIQKKVAEEEQLKFLDKHLGELGIALPEALMKYSPACRDVIITCRWQSSFLPSRKLFQKQFTELGLCCVLEPIRLQKKTTHRLFDHLETTRRLDLALSGIKSSRSDYRYELLLVYDGEEDLKPQVLHRGFGYWLQVAFITTLDNGGSLFDVKGGCVRDKGYSRIICIAKCFETICGCSDPLQTRKSRASDLPVCNAAQLNCLRSITNYEKSSCRCPPKCTKFTTDTTMETNPLDFKYSYDPLFYGLNSSTANIVHVYVRLRLSKIFYLLPTETWLTLLSSLGGVFNMFLGVGLFSALEFLFLLIFKLPPAVKKSAEMTVPTVPEPHYH